MEENRHILLSFIIPVFNSELYLKACVDSILLVGSNEIEILLIDDGSTDQSTAICDMYALKNNNVKVIHKENGGVASARNRGILESSGEYIFFIDNDDLIKCEKLNALIDILKNSNVDIVFNRYVILNENGTQEQGNAFIQKQRINGKSRDEVLDYIRLKRINIMAPWEYVIKRKIIVDNLLSFDVSQNGVDDSSFSPILFSHCFSFYIMDEAIYVWRQRSTSQGKSHNKHAYILKMMSTITALDQYFKSTVKTSERSISNYILFCIYKNAYSLLGQYDIYSGEDKKLLNTWYDEKKSLIKRAARQSGFVHASLNTLFGGLTGITLSYKLAVLKGSIYSHIYGHSSRTTTKLKKI